MIHCKSVKKCEELAKEIATETGIEDYILLFSSKENKKASMQYFLEAVAKLLRLAILR